MAAARHTTARRNAQMSQLSLPLLLARRLHCRGGGGCSMFFFDLADYLYRLFDTIIWGN
jgi:hypothetical protein